MRGLFAKPPAGGCLRRSASCSTSFKTAVDTRLRCCLKARSTAAKSVGTRAPLFASVYTCAAYCTGRSFVRSPSSYRIIVFVSLKSVSHLFTQRTTARPLFEIMSAILKSCSVGPCNASSTSTATSLRRIAKRLLPTLIASISSPIFETFCLRRMPAVSTKTTLRCGSSGLTTSTSTASRVVPAMSLTTRRSSPRTWFSRLDFPTFGRPMMHTRQSSSSPDRLSASCVIPSMLVTTSSRRSATPVPEIADIAYTFSRP
mmetsp:Transcript_12432/g.33073  ORF Transcript_12432/g.33073 Transcript_12432/m.33073 type:complete len:258 (+) Transcript_12432:193-966(+)